jgi:hypothetical protein
LSNLLEKFLNFQDSKPVFIFFSKALEVAALLAFLQIYIQVAKQYPGTMLPSAGRNWQLKYPI